MKRTKHNDNRLMTNKEYIETYLDNISGIRENIRDSEEEILMLQESITINKRLIEQLKKTLKNHI